MPGREGAEDLDEDRRVGGPGDADRQLADFALVQPRRQVGRVGGLGQDDPRLLHEHAAGFGELDLALGAVKELHLQLFFELADLVAERRLAQMQPFRGAAEVQRVGQHDDVAEVPQLHALRILNESRLE